MTVFPGVGLPALTGFAPTATVTHNFQALPGTAVLTLTGQAPSVTLWLPVYAFFDLLTVIPDWGDAREDVLDHATDMLDPGTGVVTIYDHGPQPTDLHKFRWFIQSRGDSDQVRAFFAARRGQAVPFWVPTWRQDLVLHADVAFGATSVVVQWCSYTNWFWQTGSRRHVCFILPNGTMLTRKVTASNDNGDGTETLTIDAAPGVPLPASSTIVAFLLFCRLDSDMLQITWETQQTAIAEFTFAELAMETPT